MNRIVPFVFLLAAAATAARAQTSAFLFEPGRLESGTVYHYVKSNIDGSRPGRIALYVAAENAIESFKYHDDGDEATLVKATMNWDDFTVDRFESWRLGGAGGDVLRAELERVPGTRDLEIRVGDSRFVAPIEHWPWHSYDFDFASLGLAFRFLVDRGSSFEIGVADVDRSGDGPPFRDKGTVAVIPAGIVERDGIPCRAYLVDGPGLEHRGGTMWVAREGAYLVGYEIDLPDEPGFDSGKLRLESIETMSAEEWARFKAERTGP